MQKIFLSFARPIIVSFRADKKLVAHAQIAEKTCLTAKQVRCRRLFDRLAVAIANQTETRLQTACTFCCTTQVCLDICAVDF